MNQTKVDQQINALQYSMAQTGMSAGYKAKMIRILENLREVYREATELYRNNPDFDPLAEDVPKYAGQPDHYTQINFPDKWQKLNLSGTPDTTGGK